MWRFVLAIFSSSFQSTLRKDTWMLEDRSIYSAEKLKYRNIARNRSYLKSKLGQDKMADS